MKVSSVQPYSPLQKIYQTGPMRSVGAPAPREISSLPEQSASKTFTPESVISPAEREYFMKLFPENSSQISRHVVFTRNGNVEAAALSKGRIFDGRA